MNIAGIDIGLSGAIAILNEGNIITLMDMPVIKGDKTELDEPEIRNILTSYEVRHCFMERVHSMPQQGIVSTSRFMTVYGIIRGICVGLSIPYTLILPQRWKKAIMEGMPKDKGASIIRAKQLYPDINLDRKKDHNKADALLIGLYGLKAEILTGKS